MDFKAIKVETPNSVAIQEAFNRSEQNTEKAFADLSTNVQLPVLSVASSATVATYIVKPDDRFIVVNSSGGAFKVVLPAPPGPTQDVWIKCAKGRAITIVQSDGKMTAVPLDVTQSKLMVNTGTTWEAFGG